MIKVTYVNENLSRQIKEFNVNGDVSFNLPEKVVICYVEVDGISVFPNGLTTAEQMLIFGTISISDLEPNDFRRAGSQIELRTQVDALFQAQKLFYDGATREDFLAASLRNGMSDLRKMSFDMGLGGRYLHYFVSSVWPTYTFAVGGALVVTSGDCTGVCLGNTHAVKAGVPVHLDSINYTTAFVSFIAFY